MHQQNPYGHGGEPEGWHPAQPGAPVGPGHSAPSGHSAPTAYAAAGYAQQPQGPPPAKRSSALAVAGWGITLTVALVAGGIGIWQVDERVYTADATAENYWNAMASGDGAEALSLFAPLPEDGEEAEENGADGTAESRGLPTHPIGLTLDAADEGEDEDDEHQSPGSTDSVLLEGEALQHSAGLIDALEITERPSAAGLSFTVDEEDFEAELPMTREGSVWLFFDDWKLREDVLTTVDLAVPGSEAGGIAQVDVNGQPVNLQDEATELAAFLPSVIDVDVDSEWLSGSLREVVADPGEEHDIELELEASDAAREQLHTEVEEFLEGCAEQQVLMPSGCPMGVETPNTVDSETIEWDMPDASGIDLTFGPDGWQVSGASGLTATAEFDSLDHHDGDELEESHDESFSLDIRIGASAEELVVSVADPDSVDGDGNSEDGDNGDEGSEDDDESEDDDDDADDDE